MKFGRHEQALAFAAGALAVLLGSLVAMRQVTVWWYLQVLLAAAAFGGLVVAGVLAYRREQVERRERADERRYRTLLERMPEGLALADADGNRVIEANHAFCQLLGYDAAAIVGIQLQDLFEPADGAMPIAARLHAGVPFADDGRGRRADQRLVDLEVKGTRLKLGAREVWYVLARDITVRKRIQQELQNSQARFLRIFEDAALGMVLLDLDGRATETNGALQTMLGYGPLELRGTLLAEISHPSAAPGDRERFHELAAGRRDHYELDKPFTHKDGRIIWGHLVVSLVRDAADEPQFAIGMVQDITERRRQADAVARRARELGALYETSLSISGQLELTALLHTLVRRAAELLDAPIGALYLVHSEEDSLRLAASYNMPNRPLGTTIRMGEGLTGRVAQTGQPLTLEGHRLWEDTNVAPSAVTGPMVRLLAVPLKLGERVIGVLSIGDDRLAGRFTQDDIRLLNLFANQAAIAVENARLFETSQRELSERKRAEASLREYALQLQARNEELDAFAHTVAHDLQNPVTTIMGFAATLEGTWQTFTQEELDGYLRTIAQAGRKTANIIQELLLLAGVRKTTVLRHELDMASVVQEARDRLLYAVEECHAEIVLPDSWPVAFGYGPWVEEVWVNYISNALKYGGTPPRIELGGAVQPDGSVRFWARDNGKGLTPEEQQRVFVPFTRFSQVRTSGHGLGLSIVHRIVGRLGGQVGVESQPGQGSTFWFTLPSE